MLEKGGLPQAVIIDMRLPDASGGLLLRRVRRANVTVAVAVVAGMTDPASHPELVRFPPDRIFTKPVNMDELTAWLLAVT
jgi:DNA-binding response OmpR family regulator